MKLKLFLLIALGTAVFSHQVYAENDVVKVKGEACEKFSDSQSKSSVRVRVTDKASYNAVSKVEDLKEIRSKMMEHDFNVIVYNLVDNYVQDLMVRTVNQNNEELCVEVTGEIPAAEIVNVIANYSATEPAPEYDFKKANDVEEIELEEILDESAVETEPEADILYEPTEEVLEQVMEEPVDGNIDMRAKVYIAPVEFYNNTSSQKSSEVLREFFNNPELYSFTEDKDIADYIILPRVLKAKIDPINAKTKRLQMVVSVELKTNLSDASVTEHQNRFVLFEEGEEEQDVAQNLLKKLMQKSGEKIQSRVDQYERKRRNLSLPPIITPNYNS
jgi:hypothetical protein